MNVDTKVDLKYKFIETQDGLEKIIEELENQSIIGLDTEATKFDPFTAKLLLIQLATNDNVFVIDTTKVDISPIKHILESDRPLKLVQNAKFDYKLLKVQAGISLGALFDTMIAERILTMGISREISLKVLAEKYLGMIIDKSVRETFIDQSFGSSIREFSTEQLEYSARDAFVLRGIFEKQFKKLQEEELINTAKLEFSVIPAVANMELYGSLIDKIKWRKYIAELREKRDASNKEIQNDLRHLSPYSQVDLFGNETDTINLDSPLQVL